MEAVLILGLVILAFYLFVRLVARGISSLAGARYKAYRQLAAKYRGRYESRGLVDPPTVSFAYNGSSVRVGLAPTIAGQVTSPRTRVVARFGQGLPFRLELAPSSRAAPAQPPKGTRSVRLADPEFDRSYNVRANDPEIAAEFLRSAARQAVERLRRLAPPSGMLVSINPERLLVQVDRNLGGQSVLLEAAVREALVLHDCLNQGVAARLAAGIDIVAVGTPAPDDAGPPVCKVCGDPIVALHVVCAVCQTPHHRDCWTFVGGCSIFGCQGKQCIPA